VQCPYLLSGTTRHHCDRAEQFNDYIRCGLWPHVQLGDALTIYDGHPAISTSKSYSEKAHRKFADEHLGHKSTAEARSIVCAAGGDLGATFVRYIDECLPRCNIVPISSTARLP